MSNRSPFSPITNSADWRSGFIFAILRFTSLFGIFLLAISFPSASIRDRIVYIIIYLIVLAFTIARLSLTARAYGLLSALMAYGLYSIANFGPRTDGSIFLLAGVLLSALLFERHRDYYTLAAGSLGILLLAVLQQTNLLPLKENIANIKSSDWVVYIFSFAAIGMVLIAALNQFKSTFTTAAEETHAKYGEISGELKRLEGLTQEQSEKIEARASQIRTSSNTLRILAGLQHISELLDTSTRLLSDEFGYYHVGLLIIDDQGKNAYLQASSSTAGVQLIGHSFPLLPDKKNPYVLAVERNRSVITSDSDPRTFAADSNFPLTRSRLVVPLNLRNQVIGLLDVHSDRTQAFDMQDAEIMQVFADLTAVSFENIRLTNEIKNLVAQIETNSSAQAKRAWTKLTNRNKPAYQYTPAGVRPIFSPDKRIESGDLYIPLILQGQKIGSIKLKRKGSSLSWSDRDQVLVEKIADQVALALENSRLVDEAQKNALRDQMIANISTQIRETLDIDAVVRTATMELRRVFDLKEAEIIIGAAQLESASKRI